MSHSRSVSTKDAIGRIVGEAMRDHAAHALLARLTDDIGPRPAGSPQAAAAVEWAEAALASRGIRCWREELLIPRWERGEAEARIVSARDVSMSVLALGGSVSTPPGGIEAG